MMKLYLFLLLPMMFPVMSTPGIDVKKHPASSPLAVFSPEWNDSKYLQCNTAANAGYMNDNEKNVIYILNLLRTDPVLFAKTVVQVYPEFSGQGYLRNTEEFKSLFDTLHKIGPLPLLFPDSLCFVSARCHAMSAGTSSYVGHERKSAECKIKKRYYGECCDYGHTDPLQILMSLLIDEYTPTLGHRIICLGDYKKIGVSIQPHKSYGNNAVLDFYY